MGRSPKVELKAKRTNVAYELGIAEGNKIYNTQYGKSDFGYVYKDGWLKVVMPTGTMSMKLDRATQFSKDLMEMCEEIADLVERRIL